MESIHYRDFSRYFDTQHGPTELKPLRKSFNEINTTFKLISKEKETQYQYLQKILELVNTGILSFEHESGLVIWMNESLKKLLQVPYLKSIQSLEKRDRKLYNEIISLTPGSTKVTIMQIDNRSFKIFLSATAFQTDEKKYRLIAFQNINQTLDETESKAWQKLLSVMTHEIMNSVAPISSLAETLKKKLQNGNSIDGEDVEDIELGIETIQRRSEGLLKFARTYRNLNKVTTLNLNTIHIHELFSNLYKLMQPTFDKKGVDFEIILKDPEVTLLADSSLIEQVLINLIVNALESINEPEQGKVILSAERNIENKTILKVIDNGKGISEELLDQIFIPFFSTKPNGSGIGLSLSKQIVLLHNGNINVHSIEGKGTVFTLEFHLKEEELNTTLA